ncbi:MAG: hypothetical protein H6684_15460 [Deltaproteobacteria bacterium]|nr:hypothetical protein [bacterium]MCB9475725.1 hypothetical protein [Deltaproteobacteria bacterium]MCB9479247.1 hypothetical protein [Deltaproteobacteria bacterium]MCB9490127.1 hypothetical protein [Deltaproteobacteria bacterium]
MTRNVRIWFVLAAVAIFAATVFAAACSSGDDDDDDDGGLSVGDDDSSSGDDDSSSGGDSSDCEGAVNDLYVSCGGSVEGATAQQAYDACVSNSGGAGCIADAWNATSEDGTCEDYFANLSSRCGG